MKVVAGVELLKKFSWMLRISHGCIEIKKTVQLAAGPNTAVHLLQRGLYIVAVVVGTLVRSQRSAEYSDYMLVRAINELLKPHDKVMALTTW